MKYLMKHVQRAAEEVGLWSDDVWDETRVLAVYRVISPRFNFKNNPRHQGIVWSSIARELYRRKCVLVGEQLAD